MFRLPSQGRLQKWNGVEEEGQQLLDDYTVNELLKRLFPESHRPFQCQNLKRYMGKGNKNLVTDC